MKRVSSALKLFNENSAVDSDETLKTRDSRSESMVSNVVDESDFIAGCLFMRAAASGNDSEIAIRLRENPGIVSFKDYDKRTPLHVAASEGHMRIVTMLLDAEAEISPSDRWGGSPMDDALRHRHKDIAKLLRERGARHGNVDTTLALISFAAKGDSDEVRRIILEGVDANSKDYDFRTPLHLACGEGHTEVVKILLEAGADPNSEDRWSGLPLDDAILKGHAECEKLLLDAGAITPTRESAASTPTKHRGISKPGSDSALVVGAEAADRAGLAVNWDDIAVLEKIGAGAFGDIFKCKWRGTLVAAKVIRSREPKKVGAVDDNKTLENRDAALADFRQEITILANLRHPNICLLLGYSLTKKHAEVMISELMKCSLQDVLRSLSGAKMSQRRAIRYAIQLAKGMNYLHTCKQPIIHRDLKPGNLLIDFHDTLKVSDFGLAKFRPDVSPSGDSPPSSSSGKGKGATTASTKAVALYDTEGKYLSFEDMTGETGSYRYMAPEVFKHKPYGRPVDVYSFSIILYYMLSSDIPWPGTDGLKAAQKAAFKNDRPGLPRHWDAKITRLLCASWDVDPALRPSFAAVLDELNEYHTFTFKQDYSDAVAQPSTECCAVS